MNVWTKFQPFSYHCATKTKLLTTKVSTNWPLKAGSTVHNGNCEQAIEATTMIVFRRHGQYCHTMEIRELFPRNNLI